MTELEKKIEELTSKRNSLTEEIKRINSQLESLEYRLKEERRTKNECKDLYDRVILYNTKGDLTDENSIYTEKSEEGLSVVFYKNDNNYYVFDEGEEKIYLFEVRGEKIYVVIYEKDTYDNLYDSLKEDAIRGEKNTFRKGWLEDCEYNGNNSGLEEWLEGVGPDLTYYDLDDLIEDYDRGGMCYIEDDFKEKLEDIIDFKKEFFIEEKALSLTE